MEKSASRITLSESIYECIRRDIITDQLPPGSRINIRDLCERYGASETPIRLALNRLVSENIIENFPRQGMRVRELNISSCEETFELRKMLETYYLSSVIMTLSVNASMRSTLEKNVEESMALIRELTPSSPLDDYLRNYEYDMEFHLLLIRSTGNALLMDLFQHLNPFLYINYLYHKQSPERMLTGVREHQAILEALLAGDEERAREAVLTHLDNGRRAIISILKIEQMM